jgi:hypothetical protein
VVCGEPTLRQLLLDIDTMCWSDHSMARAVYEIVPVGAAGWWEGLWPDPAMVAG